MKKHRLFISSKKDFNDKRILDSFNEFMNSSKVSGILIIEEI